MATVVNGGKIKRAIAHVSVSRLCNRHVPQLPNNFHFRSGHAPQGRLHPRGPLVPLGVSGDLEVRHRPQVAATNAEQEEQCPGMDDTQIHNVFEIMINY